MCLVFFLSGPDINAEIKATKVKKDWFVGR